MQPIPRRILLVLLLLLGLGWIFVSRTSPEATTAGSIPVPQVGFLAPDFTLNDIDGDAVALSSLRGQPVVLNFWASWCPPCKAEMPALQAVSLAYEGQAVVLAVNAANQDLSANALAFLSQNSLTFPVLFDRDGTAQRLYSVQSLPTTFFIDAVGKIRDLVVGGPMTEAGLRSRIDALLEETH
jgi:cytochrome c biogenesis protein CcmG, thiol:disulfide interchange protein DsbE